MNHATTAITLNMQLPNIAAVAWAVQGDQLSRELRCTLVDGSTPWNPQAGYHAVVRYFKPDGTNGVYDVDEDGNPAVTWTGNVAMVTLAQQAMTVAGTVIMQLEFYDSNDARVTAFGWAMNVQPSAVTDTEFLSTDYYNILTLQIAGVLGSSGHPPYIDGTTKNWMVWDENAADYVDSGYSSVGMTGPAPVVTGTAYRYANSNSGTTVPTSWSNTRPATQPGTWAWTETTITFDNDTTTTFYSTAYQGNDGTGSPGTSLPLMDGTADVGTANAYAREDHVHPTDSNLQTEIDFLKSDIGIVEDTNTATHAISQGQYVVWKGALYTASQAIALGATLSNTNLTAVGDGGLNALQNVSGTSYCKMPDGTLIQWGIVINTSVGYASVTFNESFSNDSFVFMATPRYSSSYPQINYRTVTQKSGVSSGVVNFKPLSSTDSYTTPAIADWVAIGRWR